MLQRVFVDDPMVKGFRNLQEEKKVDDSLPLIEKDERREWLQNELLDVHITVEEDL